MSKKLIKIAVTGAAGQIGYALLFRIAAGEMFGAETEVQLNLLELESALPALRGVVMELEDCAFPLLKNIIPTSDARQAFRDVDWALLVGSVPRRPGMERADLLKINGKIFTSQGQAIDSSARASCRVLVVGNPCNTNAYLAKSVAKNIPAKNFFAMTMLDEKRAVAQLAAKAGVSSSEVKNIAIWGNHSTTQFPDFYHGVISGKPVLKVIPDEEWLKTVFIERIQKRGAEILNARGVSSAASAAGAIIETVKRITAPTPKGEFFSLGVCSEGSYGIPEGLIFSFPVCSNGQEWQTVAGIEHGSFSQEKIAASLKELLDEKEAVRQMFCA